METDREKIERVWLQNKIPVIQRPENGKLKIKPSGDGYYHPWLFREGKHRPIQIKNYYEVPVAWLSWLVKECLNQSRSVWIIQPYNDKQVCTASCRNAEGFECECQCLGENHGQGDVSGNGWYEINDALKIKWSGKYVAARLLTDLI